MSILNEIEAIVGTGNVLTGAAAEPYGQTVTGKYSAAPACVVKPGSTAQVSAVMRLASAQGAPVVPVGGNTGLVGGTSAGGAWMLSLERMNAIREIRSHARIAIVEAGLVLGRLHEAAEERGLVFPLFFGARGSAMIGGCLATNAGGSNVLRYGNARALCLGLEVVLPDGRVLDLMSELHKDNSGYDLKDLFIGAEGTLGVITAAVLRLAPQPRAYATAMVSAASLPAALELLNRLQDASGGMVEAFEYMPRTYMRRLAQARPDLVPPLGHDRDATVLIELGATSERDAKPDENGALPVTELLTDELAAAAEAGLVDDAAIARSGRQRRDMWALREVAAEISLNRSPRVETDIAVALDRTETFLDRAIAGLARIDPAAETITVAHLGDGNIHFTVWPSREDDALEDAILAMVEDTVVGLGGSFSAEHGVGISKLASMQRRKDAVAVEVMRTIKQALDPQNIMNPGKVLPPG